jgi:hypothetical protein
LFLPEAISKVNNFLTAKVTQRAQGIDNKNYNFASLAISLRPLRLKILLKQPLVLSGVMNRALVVKRRSKKSQVKKPSRQGQKFGSV